MKFNVWGIFTWVISLILLVAALSMLFFKININNSYKTFLVQSGSMSPTLKAGDLIVVKPNKIYSTGDIVTFNNSNNQKVTHRIANIKTENNIVKIFTKGDANKVVDDGYIFPKDIIGKLYYQIPYLGKLVFFSKTLPGLITLIVVPTLLIILGEFKKISKRLLEMFSR
jgi:signal peptidase I